MLEQNQTENHQVFSDVFCKHCMQKQIKQTKTKTASVWLQPKTNQKGRHTNLPPACTTRSRCPWQQTTHRPPNGPAWHDPTSPSIIPWRKQQVFGLLLFFVWLPRRLFSNLRTACSETLMLRERKASMADRSLSSLTGELLLLATAAAAFATFAARRLSGDENPWQTVKGTGPGWRHGGGGH